jgi:hypothetical protein
MTEGYFVEYRMSGSGYLDTYDFRAVSEIIITGTAYVLQ